MAAASRFTRRTAEVEEEEVAPAAVLARGRDQGAGLALAAPTGGPVTAQGPRAGAGPSPGTGRGQSLAPDPALQRTRGRTGTPTGQPRGQNRGRDQGLEVPAETKANILTHQNHNSPIQQHYISEWLLFLTKAQNMPANTFSITSLCFCISVVSFKKKAGHCSRKKHDSIALF